MIFSVALIGLIALSVIPHHGKYLLGFLPILAICGITVELSRSGALLFQNNRLLEILVPIGMLFGERIEQSEVFTKVGR